MSCKKSAFVRSNFLPLYIRQTAFTAAIAANVTKVKEEAAIVRDPNIAATSDLALEISFTSPQINGEVTVHMGDLVITVVEKFI